jgi:hypothetical protein
LTIFTQISVASIHLLNETHRIADHSIFGRDRGTTDERIRITNAPGDLDLERGSPGAAGSSLETVAQQCPHIAADRFVRDCPPGHRDRLEAVEFVAQFLPFLPGKELRQRHGLAESGGHTTEPITASGCRRRDFDPRGRLDQSRQMPCQKLALAANVWDGRNLPERRLGHRPDRE